MSKENKQGYTHIQEVKKEVLEMPASGKTQSKRLALLQKLLKEL